MATPPPSKYTNQSSDCASETINVACFPSLHMAPSLCVVTRRAFAAEERPTQMRKIVVNNRILNPPGQLYSSLIRAHKYQFGNNLCQFGTSVKSQVEDA